MKGSCSAVLYLPMIASAEALFSLPLTVSNTSSPDPSSLQRLMVLFPELIQYSCSMSKSMDRPAGKEHRLSELFQSNEWVFYSSILQLSWRRSSDTHSLLLTMHINIFMSKTACLCEFMIKSRINLKPYRNMESVHLKLLYVWI